jgi:hypothetical protein
LYADNAPQHLPAFVVIVMTKTALDLTGTQKPGIFVDDNVDLEGAVAY